MVGLGPRAGPESGPRISYYIRAGALIRSAPQAQTPNNRASFARELAPDGIYPRTSNESHPSEIRYCCKAIVGHRLVDYYFDI